jgi:hypothetical protein
VIHAAAVAVPPAALHQPGIWDGGDYDSLIQPLVLALDATPVEAGPAILLVRPGRDTAGVPAPSPPFTAGCGGGNYCPDAPLTRGQMAAFLSKALGLHFAP